MRTINKYKLATTDTQTLQLTQYCEILSVQSQGGIMQVWVEEDTTMPKKDITFLTFATGADLSSAPTDMTFLDTVQAGAFVWHVFVK